MQIAILSSTPSDKLMLAVNQAGMTPITFSSNESPEKLLECHGIVIAETRMTDAIIKVLKKKRDAGDPMLGIGEGARILIETGIVPGLENDKAGIKLVHHEISGHTLCLSEQYQYNAFTRFLKPKTKIKMSENAAQLSFAIPPALLLEMQMNGLIIFYYCDTTGNRMKQAAAVSNKAGNAMAILPWVDESLFFQSMRDYLEKGYRQSVQPLCYYPRI